LLIPRNFLISNFISWMTHCSLSNELFSSNCLHVFCLFLLSSSFIALCSDRMHGIISVFLYLLRLALCPMIWSILEKVPWAAEKNIYCVAVDGICRHQLDPFDVWYILGLGFLYWFFVWMTHLLMIMGC
jgi:hypothetical protein